MKVKRYNISLYQIDYLRWKEIARRLKVKSMSKAIRMVGEKQMEGK